MLEIGSFQSHVCQSITRRAFLRLGAAVPLAWGLPGLAQTAAAAEPRRAKSVLLVWLWGAPSHLDTCDPKPGAPAEYRGPFSTIPTRTPGVHFTELLPKLASRTDRFALVRANRNFHQGHTEAGTFALTGATGGDPLTPGPNFGSMLARRRGYGQLPPFMSLGRGSPRDVVGPVVGHGGGAWGSAYDPFLVACSDDGEVSIPTLKLLDGLTPERLGDRRLLLGELDQIRRTVDDGALRQWDGAFNRAYSLLTSPEARKALDLSQEQQATREAYGQTSFGQSCLLGRRLLEAGVPYVQVNWSQYVECMTPNCDFGWDTHIYNFDLLPDRHCPIFDRAFSALLDDLYQRGLIETTLVVCMGEFGRTPKINAQASRDHWPNCYFSIWAGGGVQPGRVIGASDKLGEEPLTDPVTPLMVGTTILELAGVGTQARAELRILQGGRVIHELL